MCTRRSIRPTARCTRGRLRSGRGPVRLGVLRPARPQGPARVHGDRARQAGRCSATAAIRRSKTSGSARRWTFPATPPLATYNTVINAGPFYEIRRDGGRAMTSACSPASRSPADPGPGRRRDLHPDHPRASSSSPTGSACRFRSTSTTRSSCPSSPGRWRTTAASPGRTGSCADARRPGRAGTARGTCCTSWRTCGSATSSRCAGGTTCGSTRRSRSSPATGPPVRATSYTDAWAAHLAGEKLKAYLVDQGPTTHPIRQPVRDVSEAEATFDAITYPKGASVLQQLMTYVGEAEFSAGLTRLLRPARMGQHDTAGPDRRARRASGRDLDRGARGGWRRPAPTG